MKQMKMDLSLLLVYLLPGKAKEMKEMETVIFEILLLCRLPHAGQQMKKMKIVLNVQLFYFLPQKAKKVKNIETMVLMMLLLRELPQKMLLL